MSLRVSVIAVFSVTFSLLLYYAITRYNESTIPSHAPLIATLTTFYKLLVDLGHVPPSALVLPSLFDIDGEIWEHPANNINRAAAVANGFDDDVITLAYRIPYLVIDGYPMLHYNTEALYYLKEGDMANGEQEENQVGLQNLEEQKLLSTSESAKPEEVDDPQGEGADPWEYAHDPTFVENDNFWTGNKALLLTRGWVYGTHLIYDLDKQTIRGWHDMDEGDWSDAKAYPMTSLQNPLYVWIHDLLSLKNVPMEEGFLPPPNPIDTPYPWEDKTPGRERWWNETLVYDEKKYGLRDIYIAQGWRTDNLTEAQDAYLPVWERLELNRQRAVANFRIKEFETAREMWLQTLPEVPDSPYKTQAGI